MQATTELQGNVSNEPIEAIASTYNIGVVAI